MSLAIVRVHFNRLPQMIRCLIVTARVIISVAETRHKFERQRINFNCALHLSDSLVKAAYMYQVVAVEPVHIAVAWIQFNGSLVLALCSLPVPVVNHLDEAERGVG